MRQTLRPSVGVIVLAARVGVVGTCSDWPGTVSLHAAGMGPT
jgi:hypothetical protein